MFTYTKLTLICKGRRVFCDVRSECLNIIYEKFQASKR